jgi:hypothetical protein
MIFSQWQPDGGYDYYEADVHHPIGDDLPIVRMPSVINEIGVAAQDVGRKIPKGAEYVGSGVEPQGVMAPMSRRKVPGLSGTLSSNQALLILLLAGMLIVGGLMNKEENGRQRY